MGCFLAAAGCPLLSAPVRQLLGQLFRHPLPPTRDQTTIYRKQRSSSCSCGRNSTGTAADGAVAGDEPVPTPMYLYVPIACERTRRRRPALARRW